MKPAGVTDSKDRTEDVFIPKSRTIDAASGDLVRVRYRKRRMTGGDRRMAGEIVEVLERATHTFVGTYYETSGLGYVRVDGNEFQMPVCVGDPRAKNALSDDKVVIEMVRFPTSGRNGEGVITEVLGKRGDPEVDTRAIILEFSLPQEFPQNVLDNAREQADAFDESLGEDRIDLTQTTVVTIDPKDARDFDDAISLQKLEGGNWQLGVHIADVAHFVQPGSPLDQEARERATSVYLPDRVIPMLPEVISNNLASLQPNRIRYAKTVFMEFSPEGTPIASEFCASAIRSDRRFTYEEYGRLFDRPRKLEFETRRAGLRVDGPICSNWQWCFGNVVWNEARLS